MATLLIHLFFRLTQGQIFKNRRKGKCLPSTHKHHAARGEARRISGLLHEKRTSCFICAISTGTNYEYCNFLYTSYRRRHFVAGIFFLCETNYTRYCQSMVQKIYLCTISVPKHILLLFFSYLFTFLILSEILAYPVFTFLDEL
uniref:Vomeronasal type-1 receptor n=1 Tax=Cacopsylla melanoneura TaxID=428564 RepID=A0A8D8ZF33_9HEMI